MSSRRTVDETRREADQLRAEIYGWKSKSMVKANAYTVAQLFADIRRQHGIITPQLVVDQAADPTSPIHDCIEWDDQRAAASYRLIQARHLMQNLTVRYRQEDGTLTAPVRYLVKLQHTGNSTPVGVDDGEEAFDPGVYIPIRTVMETPDWRDRYVYQAWADLARWRDRYREIELFSRIFSEIEALAPQFHRREVNR